MTMSQAATAVRPAPNVIEMRGVTRTLEGEVPVTLVRDVDLDIGAGDFVAITGPSGSGKSSLLYLLGLLDRPSEGEVWLEGRETSELGDAERAAIRLRRLGFVFQFHFLLPEFNVLQNVLLPLRKAGDLKLAEALSRAESILLDLDLADCLRKMPDQLSGGQRQRVAIARALANNPLIVLADEPTGNLDTKNAAAVFDIFERLVAEQGRSVVTVTHDPALAGRTHRQVHIVDGRIVRA